MNHSVLDVRTIGDSLHGACPNCWLRLTRHIDVGKCAFDVRHCPECGLRLVWEGNP